MSKPQTKGRTIGVRLPLPADAAVRRRADEESTTPGLWIARAVVASLGAKEGHVGQRPRPERVVADTEHRNGKESPAVSTCRHEKINKLTYGPWKCEACGALSRDRGASWRI